MSSASVILCESMSSVCLDYNNKTLIILLSGA